MIILFDLPICPYDGSTMQTFLDPVPGEPGVYLVYLECAFCGHEVLRPLMLWDDNPHIAVVDKSRMVRIEASPRSKYDPEEDSFE